MLALLQLGDLWFERGGVCLHAVAAGPHDGPLVILLHGFPEFWYSWHKQIEPLANAGFRVVAPDQRGYNVSSKPTEIADYAVGNLVADVIAIADQLGREKFFLAGHDWGAAVAWATALQHPQRVKKLAILNVPHPAVFQRTLRHNPRQMLRSWYMAFFQIAAPAGVAILIQQLRSRRESAGGQQPSRDVYARRSRSVPEGLDEPRYGDGNDQLVSRILPHQTAAAT